MYEPKLTYPQASAAPDAFDETAGIFPSNDFVVSRDLLGRRLSRYGDLHWDFTAYSHEEKRDVLYFKFWEGEDPAGRQVDLSFEVRRIMFCLVWLRTGVPLSVGTLRNYLSVLKFLASYAYTACTSVLKVLADKDQLIDFATNNCSGWMAETLCSLLTLLERISSDASHLHIVSHQTITVLKRRNKIYREGIKQHPPMPTRIYSIFISGIQKELLDWQEVSDNLLSVAHECGLDPRVGRSKRRQPTISRKHNLDPCTFPEFSSLIDGKSAAYFKAKSLDQDLRSLSTLIGHAQYFAKLLIQTFTGMRDDEVNSLPYFCAETTVSGGSLHYLVVGRTTKFSHGLAKRARWVTNKEGFEAIKIAQQIANAIYGALEIEPARSVDALNFYPLFVAVSYLRFAGMEPEQVAGRFRIGSMAHREIPDACLARIQEDDLLELEHIDPHRAWSSEKKFRLGNRWTFTSHQTRRSLALYAQRSGLVSLPSLRRQLKHITNEMSRYYARGSAFAKNFLQGDVNHFGVEWQAAQLESSALSYLKNVLMVSDTLFGGHATWVQQRLAQPGPSPLKNREATIQLFKRGELFYRETLIGGCTNLGTCEKPAIRCFPISCIIENCRNLAGSISKLNLVISAQQNLVDSLDTETVEYRTELEDLKALIAARSRILIKESK